MSSIDHRSPGMQPRHSTPVKKYGNSGFAEGTLGTSSAGILNINDLESTTVEKQRKELQLLVGELKDRDKELNEMVAAHQHQLAAWERDRQRVLTLEKRNNKLEGEIKKRQEQIRLLIQRLKVSESQHKSKDAALETSQVRLRQLEKDMSNTKYEVQDLKEKNVSLDTSLSDMSTKVGKMESKEAELLISLRNKERELIDVNDQVSLLSSKLRSMDAELRESQRSEGQLRSEVHDERLRYKQGRQELDNLKADMIEKTNEMLSYRKEVLKLKDEIHHLQKEICLREEEVRRKDELIDLQRSKQDRVDKELAALRLIYERQQRDLSELHKSLANSQEMLEKQEERLNDISQNSLELSGIFDDSDDCGSETTNDLIEEARRSTSASAVPDIPDDNQNTSTIFEPSPTSKLQKLIAESREMVHNLERTAMTPLPRPLSARDSREHNTY